MPLRKLRKHLLKGLCRPGRRFAHILVKRRGHKQTANRFRYRINSAPCAASWLAFPWCMSQEGPLALAASHVSTQPTQEALLLSPWGDAGGKSSQGLKKTKQCLLSWRAERALRKLYWGLKVLQK